LYFPTTTTKVKSSSVSSSTVSSKIINESKVINDHIMLTTTMSEKNVAISNVTIMSTIKPSILTSNIIYSTYSSTPPTTLEQTEVSKINSTLSLNFTPFPIGTYSSIKAFNNDSTMVSNITTKITHLVNLTSTATIPTYTNVTTPTLIKTVSSTITPLIINTTIEMMTTKLFNIPNMTNNLSLENTHSITPEFINTSSSTIRTTIMNKKMSTTAFIYTPIQKTTFSSGNSNITTPIINISNSINKPVIINTIPITNLSNYSTTKTGLTVKSNVSINFEQMNNTFKNKFPSVHKITDNIIIEEIKPTMNNMTTQIPHMAEYSNISSVTENNLVAFDDFLPNSK